MRKLIDLIETGGSKKTFVGTCVNSFDEDGVCVAELPYADVSAFAVGEENATQIRREEFEQHTFTADDDPMRDRRQDIEYLHDENNDVYMIYDPVADIHYFYA